MVMAAVRKVHAWAGLGLCFLLIPMSLSGAALVFKPQWLRATVPGAAAAVPATSEEAARAMAAAEQAFEAPKTVMFAGPQLGMHEVIAAEGGAYLAAGTGEVAQRWRTNERAVDWLFDLHHRLLAGETGILVTGYAGLATALMLVTGLVVWAPAWRSFRGRVAPSGHGRAAWLGAHRDLGILSAPVAIVVVLTGSGVALSGLSAQVMGFERTAPPAASEGRVDWPRAMAAAQARFPNAELRMAIRSSGPGKPASVRLRQPLEWHTNGRTIVYIDPATSTVLAVDDAMSQSASARLYNAFWPIHASKVGGLLWKVLTFLTGIGLAALAAYGLESYRRKLFPPSTRPRRPAEPARQS